MEVETNNESKTAYKECALAAAVIPDSHCMNGGLTGAALGGVGFASMTRMRAEFRRGGCSGSRLVSSPMESSRGSGFFLLIHVPFALFDS